MKRNDKDTDKNVSDRETKPGAVFVASDASASTTAFDSSTPMSTVARVTKQGMRSGREENDGPPHNKGRAAGTNEFAPDASRDSEIDVARAGLGIVGTPSEIARKLGGPGGSTTDAEEERGTKKYAESFDSSTRMSDVARITQENMKAGKTGGRQRASAGGANHDANNVASVPGATARVSTQNGTIDSSMPMSDVAHITKGNMNRRPQSSAVSSAHRPDNASRVSSSSDGNPVGGFDSSTPMSTVARVSKNAIMRNDRRSAAAASAEDSMERAEVGTHSHDEPPPETPPPPLQIRGGNDEGEEAQPSYPTSNDANETPTPQPMVDVSEDRAEPPSYNNVSSQDEPLVIANAVLSDESDEVDPPVFAVAKINRCGVNFENRRVQVGLAAALLALIGLAVGLGISLANNDGDAAPNAAQTDVIFATDAPTASAAPSDVPSMSPTDRPSAVPSVEPTAAPSIFPSALPTNIPSPSPSDVPTYVPSDLPSLMPSASPTSLFWSPLGDEIDGEATLDNFGSSVAISGDGRRIAVGAPDSFGEFGIRGSGFVEIFELIENRWQAIGNITGDTADELTGARVSMARDGSCIALAAPGRDGNGTSLVGQLKIFHYSSFLWNQVGRSILGEASFDRSGWAISLSEDCMVVAIGASNNRGAQNLYRSGHVRVYRYHDEVEDWIQMGDDLDGEQAYDEFGWSVALSATGDVLAASAPYYQPPEYSSFGGTIGRVRIYRFHNNTWVPMGESISGNEMYAAFGYRLSMSSEGGVIAVSARDNDEDSNNGEGGRTRVFGYIGGNWTQLGTPIDGEGPDDFATRVSLSGDGLKLAIGAPSHDGDDEGVNNGHVRVFQFAGEDWVPIGLEIEGLASSNMFGGALALSRDGRRLAVGSARIVGSCNFADCLGHVRVFELQSE